MGCQRMALPIECAMLMQAEKSLQRGQLEGIMVTSYGQRCTSLSGRQVLPLHCQCWLKPVKIRLCPASDTSPLPAVILDGREEDVVEAGTLNGSLSRFDVTAVSLIGDVVDAFTPSVELSIAYAGMPIPSGTELSPAEAEIFPTVRIGGSENDLYALVSARSPRDSKT